MAGWLLLSAETWSPSNTSSDQKAWALKLIALHWRTWSPTNASVPPSRARSEPKRRNWWWALAAACWCSPVHIKTCTARWSVKFLNNSKHCWCTLAQSRYKYTIQSRESSLGGSNVFIRPATKDFSFRQLICWIFYRLMVIPPPFQHKIFRGATNHKNMTAIGVSRTMLVLLLALHMSL